MPPVKRTVAQKEPSPPRILEQLEKFDEVDDAPLRIKDVNISAANGTSQIVAPGTVSSEIKDLFNNKLVY